MHFNSPLNNIFCLKVLELAGNAARDNKKTRDINKIWIKTSTYSRLQISINTTQLLILLLFK